MREKTKCKIKALFGNNIELYITSNFNAPIELLTINDFKIFDSFGMELQISFIIDRSCGHYSIFIASGIPSEVKLENSYFIGSKTFD